MPQTYEKQSRSSFQKKWAKKKTKSIKFNQNFQDYFRIVSYEQRRKRYVVLYDNEKLMLYFARDKKKLKTKQNFWVWYNLFQKDKRKQIGYNTMCKIISRMKAKEELEKDFC